MSFIKTVSTNFFQLQSELGFEGHTSTLATSFQSLFLQRQNLKFLCFRRWFRRLCVFDKIKITQLPSYLYELIPKRNHNYTKCCRTCIFKIPFFPDTIVKWNKLDANLKNAKSYMCFRNSLLKIGRAVRSLTFQVFETQ